MQDLLKGRCGRKRSSTDNESAEKSCKLLHDPQRNHLGNVPRETDIEKSIFIEFCEPINDIPLPTMQTVCLSVRRRCWECTLTEGGHFEHVRA